MSDAGAGKSTSRRGPCRSPCTAGALALSLLASASLAHAGSPRAASVRISGFEGAAVARAVDGAARRLTSPECQSVLADFRDADGVSLRRHVDASGQSVHELLGALLFYDGSELEGCRLRQTLAFTARGSRIVFVCPRSFVAAQRSDPVRAEIVILHELLHALGLGEDPPTSHEITTRVMSRCRAFPRQRLEPHQDARSAGAGASTPGAGGKR